MRAESFYGDLWLRLWLRQTGHSQAAARTQGWGTNMTAHRLSLSSDSWANKADKEIKGGIIAWHSQGSTQVFITREQGSVYLQSRLPVSKQINQEVQTIRASHVLAGLWRRARRIRAFRAQRTRAPYTDDDTVDGGRTN